MPQVRRQTTKVNRAPAQTARLPSYLRPNIPTTSLPSKNGNTTFRREGTQWIFPPSTIPPPSKRPALPREPSSQPQSLLSFIPKTLSPQTASRLLAELAKIISPYNGEGFIYIFWLTPSESPTPTAEATLLFLLPPQDRPEAAAELANLFENAPLTLREARAKPPSSFRLGVPLMFNAE